MRTQQSTGIYFVIIINFLGAFIAKIIIKKLECMPDTFGIKLVGYVSVYHFGFGIESKNMTKAQKGKE